MSRGIRLRPRAVEEIELARDWYDRQKPGLGNEFVNAVESTIRRIIDTPDWCVVVYGNVRRSLIRRFPFAIFFELEPDDAIIIYSVFHTARDPGRWPKT